jgi:phage gp46-like protein
MSDTKDLTLYETGSGGDLLMKSKDLALSESLFQSIYVALFGGNIEAETTGDEKVGEERFDFWANSLLFSERTSKQFNSKTEKTLREVVINSSGRAIIARAVNSDLIFLKNISNFEVNVVILSIHKVSIEINMQSLTNQQNQSFQFIWDNAKGEVIENRII